MNTIQRYQKIFTETFQLSIDADFNTLSYQSIPSWDSVGHLVLISGIEEEFQLTMDMDDIIEFGSYTKGLEILQKYAIQF